MRQFINTAFFFLFFFSLTSAQNTSLKIGSKDTHAGATVSIPVEIIPQGTVDLMALQFNIHWNTDELTFVKTNGYTLSGLEQNDFGTPSMAGNTGELRIVWEDYPAFTTINESKTFFTIDFEVNENVASGTIIDIDFCDNCLSVAYNNNLQSMNMDYENGQIRIGALPIKLLDFTAKLKSKQSVQLDWATATETNNDRFDIERSKNGRNWKTIGSVKAAGTTNTQQNYQLLDHQPLSGNNLYRLKQIDFNGKYTYSDIRLVEVAIDEDVLVYQNPVQDNLQLSYTTSTAQQLNMTLFDANGQLLKYKEVQVVSGKQWIDWPMEDLPAGVYLVKIAGDQVRTIKVVKE